MRERARRMLVGIGIMYITQVVFLLLIVRYLMPISGPVVFHNLVAHLGYTVAAFLVGGYIIGWMAERILIVEPLVAAIGALLIDFVFTQAGLLKGTGVFLFSLVWQKGDFKDAAIVAAVAIVAAIAGALAGERRSAPQEDWVSQSFLVLGLSGLLLGPFFLLGIYLPTGYMLIVGAALLLGILIAVYRLGKSDGEISKISISPAEHTTQKAKSTSR
jgi:hypothetical protein